MEDLRVQVGDLVDTGPEQGGVSVDELQSLEETLAVLSSADLMSDIDEARVELVANAATPIGKAEAIAMLRYS